MSLELNADFSPVISIQDLPNEVQQKIFSFLNLSDRKSVSLVCHRWNSLAFEWKNITAIVHSPDEPSYGLLLASERPYRHLEIPSRWHTEEFSAKFADHLESLVLFRCHTASILMQNCGLDFIVKDHLQAHQIFPKVRELTLENLLLRDQFKIDRFIRVSFPALISLHVNHCSTNEGSVRFASFCSLQKLSIQAKFILGSTLLQDIEMLPNLRALTLICSEFSVNHLGRSFQLNHVKSLDVEANFDEELLLQITSLFSSLTSLRLKGEKQFSHESMELVKYRLPNCDFVLE